MGLRSYSECRQKAEGCIFRQTRSRPLPRMLLSHSYPYTGVGYERELPGDRSRAALDRQGYHGPPPMPTDCLRSLDNDRYLCACLPAGPGSPATRPQPPGFPRQPSQWPGGEQAMYYQDAPRYHREHSLVQEPAVLLCRAYQHRPRLLPPGMAVVREPGHCVYRSLVVLRTPVREACPHVVSARPTPTRSPLWRTPTVGLYPIAAQLAQ